MVALSAVDALSERIRAHFTRQPARSYVARALRLAMKTHASHKRDNGDPYILHPLRVSLILADEFCVDSPEIIAAALLHDVLEMSRLSGKGLENRFGKKTARIVRLLTKPKNRDAKGWEERYYLRIRRAGPPASLVKFADRLDNIRDLKNATASKRRRYLKATKKRFLGWMKAENPHFWSKLTGEMRKYPL